MRPHLIGDELARQLYARYDADKTLTLAQLGDELGVVGATVGSAIERIGGKVRKRGVERACDESAFDNAQHSPEAAYWVGLFMADGTVTDRNVVSLKLSGEDGQHVYSYRDFLKSNHSISIVQPTGVPSNSNGVSVLTKQPYYKHSVMSSRLSAALVKYGVTPHKSKTATVIELESNKWFWCGCICGDGTVAMTPKGAPTLSLVGSKFVMSQFLAFCKQLAPTETVVFPHRTIWTVRLSAHPAYLVIRELFSESPFSLPRKLTAARRIIADCDKYAKPGHMNQADKDELLELRRRGFSSIRAEAETGWGRVSIQRLYRQHGLNNLPDELKQSRYLVIPNETRQVILDGDAADVPVRSLAKQTGLTRAMVRRVLREAERPLKQGPKKGSKHPRSNSPSSAAIAEVIRLRKEEGLTYQQIESITGVCLTQAHRICVAAGLPSGRVRPPAAVEPTQQLLFPSSEALR